MVEVGPASPSGVASTVTANAGTNLNTSALALETGGNLSTIATRTPALGSAVSAASQPVVIASDQVAVPVVQRDAAGNVYGSRTSKTGTILSGAALSGDYDLSGASGLTIVGLITPAAWTAAVLTFSVSLDGITYYPLYNSSGVEVQLASSVLTVASAWIGLDPSDFVGIPHVKLRSGTNAATVNQAADRTVLLIGRSL